MALSVEVEIDEAGCVHPLQPGEKLPAGRALVIWPAAEAALGLIMSEKSLAENWLSAEEDAAWAHLQPVK